MVAYKCHPSYTEARNTTIRCVAADSTRHNTTISCVVNLSQHNTTTTQPIVVSWGSLTQQFVVLSERNSQRNKLLCRQFATEVCITRVTELFYCIYPCIPCV